jgi:hypothetical protein
MLNPLTIAEPEFPDSGLASKQPSSVKPGKFLRNADRHGQYGRGSSCASLHPMLTPNTTFFSKLRNEAKKPVLKYDQAV